MSTEKVWVVTETTGEYEAMETAVVAVAPTAELAEAFVKDQIDKALVVAVKHAYVDWTGFNQRRLDPNMNATAHYNFDTLMKHYSTRKLDVNNFFSFKRAAFRRDQFWFDIREMELLQPDNTLTITATGSAA
jgi:hypothetical protein